MFTKSMFYQKEHAPLKGHIPKKKEPLIAVLLKDDLRKTVCSLRTLDTLRSDSSVSMSIFAPSMSMCIFAPCMSMHIFAPST